jgi:hypothetical protein
LVTSVAVSIDEKTLLRRVAFRFIKSSQTQSPPKSEAAPAGYKAAIAAEKESVIESTPDERRGETTADPEGESPVRERKSVQASEGESVTDTAGKDRLRLDEHGLLNDRETGLLDSDNAGLLDAEGAAALCIGGRRQ